MSPRSLAWTPVVDRRGPRSSDPRISAARYLEQLKKRSLVANVVLASRDGIIASSLDEATSPEEVLAAALAAADGAADAGLSDEDLYTHSISLAGKDCVIASTGHRLPRVSQVKNDLARIFG